MMMYADDYEEKLEWSYLARFQPQPVFGDVFCEVTSFAKRMSYSSVRGPETHPGAICFENRACLA